MRANPAAGPEGLERHAGEEPAARRLALRAGHAVRLLMWVQRRPRVATERAVEPPGIERPRGAPVPLMLGVPGLVLRQVEPDDVAWISPEQRSMRLGPDHVVRRRDHRGQVV